MRRFPTIAPLAETLANPSGRVATKSRVLLPNLGRDFLQLWLTAGQSTVLGFQ